MTTNLPLLRVPPMISVSAEQVQVNPIICCESVEAVQPKQSVGVTVVTKQWSSNVPQSNLNPFSRLVATC